MESTERRASDAGASLCVLATLSTTIELALAEDELQASASAPPAAASAATSGEALTRADRTRVRWETSVV
jgi:hypothetical protein